MTTRRGDVTLSDRQATIVDALALSQRDKYDLAEVLDVSPDGAKSHIQALRNQGLDIPCDAADDYQYRLSQADRQSLHLDADPTAHVDEETKVTTGSAAAFANLNTANDEETANGESEPDRGDLSEREAYIYSSLPAAVSELADDLEVHPSVVEAHLDAIKQKGWTVEGDESGHYHGPDQDHLRSSEHKQTRTKKANRWWQARHDELVHEFQNLDWPTADLEASSGHEDWVFHITDLHAGDRVRSDDGRIVYSTDQIPDVVDYITQRALSLAEKHGSTYDTAHLLWGGDFVTNEGIYEGQFENLDAWLDEQHATLVAPLLRQLKAFSERFPSVQVVCQVGNHGQHRASGVSKQANADLILYKHLRNTVAAIREHAGDALGNVQFVIGEAKPYRNFELRGGRLRGHLRHGQDRRPQAETSARQSEWRGTLMEHQFDAAYLGHHHISGRIPWSGPPIFQTGSPKPAGEFVERLGGRPMAGSTVPRDVATAHGVADDGITGVFPIDLRNYQP